MPPTIYVKICSDLMFIELYTSSVYNFISNTIYVHRIYTQAAYC